MRRGTVQGTQANLTLLIGGIGIGTGSCSWRKPGTLRRSYDVGVFPLMSARRGRALRALLSCKARLRALVTDFRIARWMQQRRVGVSA
jgi:hypothetical protein